MKRRTFIATSTLATTGVVGGCLGISSFGDGGTTDDVKREVALEDSDVISGYDFDIEVELQSGQVDSESTARLLVTKTNTSGRRYIQIPQGSLFGWNFAGSQPPGLWLYNSDEMPSWVKRYKKDEKWTVRNGDAVPERHWLSRGGGARAPVIYEQGEAVSDEYELWDDRLIDGYFPTGSFRFEGRISVFESDELESEASNITWGFSIRVTS